ncbi:general stress protein [Brevundimonas diminuta]|uniref:general stress protein n=1 Tax=Brevundimonas diminuta TaxID=293 RepID=UPI000EEE93D3|nr:stress-induced protein [Brevundimonas sp.]
MAENRQQGQQQQGSSSNRGFAAMNEDKQREIASKGGSTVDPEDRSFSKDHELAAEAGRKGGQASQGGGGASASHRGDDSDGAGRGGNFADDPQRASEAGRKGGER